MLSKKQNQERSLRQRPIIYVTKKKQRNEQESRVQKIKCLKLPRSKKAIIQTHLQASSLALIQGGWLGWAMVLGSFQCRGVLLLLHIVEQGPAVLAAGAGRMGYIFYIFHLSSFSNVPSFGRRLNMTEILWFWLLKPNCSCQLLPRTSSLSTG